MESCKHGQTYICVVLFILLNIGICQGNNELRLVDGDRDSQGRVEIYHDNLWGTICDDGFDDKEAQVICRQLGYSGDNFRPFVKAYFGRGSGKIWLDDVVCNGTESNITNCQSKPWGITNCLHKEDASVDCAPDQDANIPVQLADGADGTQGRVEILHGGEYGTVCDDGFDDQAAKVVCRQLNFHNVIAVPLNSAYFTNGTGVVGKRIWLDDVNCNGSEGGLGACLHKPWAATNCKHSEDAGVLCLPISSTTNGIEVRLVGGLSHNQGRVEIKVYGIWGTVCDDKFQTRDAGVICKMLGYTRGGRRLGKRQYSAGLGPIWVDDLTCEGPESNITQCSKKPWGVNNCDHTEDVGIICTKDPAPNTPVRLINGKVPTEGRVELYYNNTWGTVCDSHWTDSEAEVICRMANIPTINATAVKSSFYGPGNGPIFMDNVDCIGPEKLIGACDFNGWGNVSSNCNHGHDASVKCPPPPPLKVRLDDGLGAYEGRVSVFYNGEWGTICDDNWGPQEAAVICRMLKYNTTGSVAYGHARYGSGTGKIWLDDVNCMGTETDLGQCGHRPWGKSNCNHNEDASVICPHVFDANNNISVRLVGSGVSYAGRVEVLYNGHWGTVCDDKWTNRNAKVVCRMLGFPTYGATPKLKAAYGQGNASQKITMDNVVCDGTEATLADCQHAAYGISDCRHREDVGVVCETGDQVKVRLVNGTSTSNGRVEIFHNNTWGTICDDDFGVNEAKVICHQLHFQRDKSRAYGKAQYGEGTGPILFDGVTCDGSEDNILECSNKGWGPGNCKHREDVSVDCNPVPVQLRLMNGLDAHSGRLEILYRGKWGTVCDDQFNQYAARVACRELHMPFSNAVSLSGSPFGPGHGPIWIDDINCFGNESDIMDCQADELPGDGNCDHTEDVGLICQWIAPIHDIKARLVNGSNKYEGRVEVYYNKRWGSVCDDKFTAQNGQVICSMLGIKHANVMVYDEANFGSGTGPIWLDDTVCFGNETSIAACSHAPWGVGNCDHSEDVGIRCTSKTVNNQGIQVKLTGSADPSMGRVEVYHNGKWGTVCDDFWGVPEATVICNQLGMFNTIPIPLPNSYFGISNKTIWLDDVNCNGTEQNLINCRFKSWGFTNCEPTETAGVMCLANVTQPAVKVRLANGLNQFQGRVEVFYHSLWGSICDDNFDIKDAAVVCKMLGYGPEATLRSFSGSTRGPIWMDEVQCTGNELSIDQCPFKGWAETNCDHKEDVAIVCTNPGFQPLPVRLSNGPSKMEGRVEVYKNVQWGTVCDKNWTNSEAAVVCRYLGYPTEGAKATSHSIYGKGTGSLLVNNIDCVGTEKELGRCKVEAFVTNTCDHSAEAGVICYTAGEVNNNIGVRLVGGNTIDEGRVEIRYNGTWGTICDDNWNVNNAKVICRMLGKSTKVVYARGSGFFRRGKGKIWLDDLDCFGNETNIDECGHRGWGRTNCRHSEDAGVVCNADNAATLPVRLVGGLVPSEGRVEIFYNQTWGTVCDDDVGTKEALVLCRMAGYDGKFADYFPKARFGAGRGPIWIDSLSCSGDEATINLCSFQQWGTSRCRHREDLSIMCQAPKTLLRLVNNKGIPSQGRVEMFINGTWGTICGDLWDAREATVVCAMLGFSRGGAVAKTNAYFGQGSGPIYMDDVDCDGPDIHIRLSNGADPNQGRLEVSYNGTWGTVCDDQFTDEAAQVVCKMAGKPYHGAYRASRGTFGPGTGKIWLDNVRCNGNEISIDDCNHGIWGAAKCPHTEDVGVFCSNVLPSTTSASTAIRPTVDSSQVFVQLVGDGLGTAHEGLVQVYYQNQWGTICDDQWTDNDASVVCGMLGFDRIGAVATPGAKYGSKSGRIWLQNVTCTGTESNIAQCHFDSWEAHGCGHNTDVAVVCPTSKKPNNFILFTNTDNIYRMDLNTKSVVSVPVSKSENKHDGIVYNPTNSQIYWADVTAHQIRTASIDGSAGKILQQLNNNSTPDDLTVDYINRLLFYTDSGNDVIGLMTFDGWAHRAVITKGLDQPRAVTLDMLKGKIYWSDLGNRPDIMVADYDGSNIKTLVNTDLVQPSGLTLDLTNNRIYWVDGGTAKIEVMTLDGQDRQTILQLDVSSHILQDISYYKNIIYYTDMSSQSIMSVSTIGTNNTPQTVGPSSFQKLGEIQVQANDAQQSGSTGCLNNRGGCSYICIPGGSTSSRCLCPDSYSLQSDGVSCSLDSSGPQINCPKDMMLSAAKGQTTVLASWTVPAASKDVIVTQSRQSPLTLSSGTYVITIKATDVNQMSNSCSFIINVTVLQCQSVKAPENGRIVSHSCSTYYGATCDVGCNNGYKLTGSSTVTCNKSGTTVAWNTNSVSCQAVTCPTLKHTAHATISGCPNINYGAICKQSCNSGYTIMDGTVNRRCLQDGSWSGGEIKCVAKGTFSNPTTTSPDHTTAIVAGSVTGFIIIVLILSITFILYKRGWPRHKGHNAYELDTTTNSLNGGFQNPTYTET